MPTVYKLPLVLTPQPEGGYTVTSPALPSLLTEGDSLPKALANVQDAFAATVELYADLGKLLPAQLSPNRQPGSIRISSKEL